MRYERNKRVKESLIEWFGDLLPDVFDTLAITPNASRRQALSTLVAFTDRVNRKIYGRNYKKNLESNQMFYVACPEGYPHFIHWHMLLKAPIQGDSSKLINGSFWESYSAASFIIAEKMNYVLSNKPIDLHGETLSERIESIRKTSSYTGKSLWYEKSYEDFVIHGKP